MGVLSATGFPELAKGMNILVSGIIHERYL